MILSPRSEPELFKDVCEAVSAMEISIKEGQNLNLRASGLRLVHYDAGEFLWRTSRYWFGGD